LTLMALYLILLPMEAAIYTIIALAVLGVHALWRDRLAVIEHPGVRAAVVLGLLWWVPLVIAQLDAVYPQAGLSRLLAFPVYVLASVFALLHLRRQDLPVLSTVAVLVLSFWSIDALVQFFYGTDLLGFPHQWGRITGVFYPDLTLGPLLAALAPVFYSGVSRLAEQRPVCWLLLLPYLGAVALAASRTAWFIWAMSTLIYLVLRFVAARRQGRTEVAQRRLLRSTLVVVVVVIASALAVDRFSPTALGEPRARWNSLSQLVSTDLNQVDEALGRRLTAWRTGFAMFAEHWVNGVGPRNYRLVYEDFAQEQDYFMVHNNGDAPTHPHLFSLEVMVDAGVIGLFCFAALLWVIWRALWRSERLAPGMAVGVGLAFAMAYFPLSMHKSLYSSFWASFAWWLGIWALASFEYARRSDRSGTRATTKRDLGGHE
nr:O-antigen ligase family protein [Gammaproteobacteria bacterium]